MEKGLAVEGADGVMAMVKLLVDVAAKADQASAKADSTAAKADQATATIGMALQVSHSTLCTWKYVKTI